MKAETSPKKSDHTQSLEKQSEEVRSLAPSIPTFRGSQSRTRSNLNKGQQQHQQPSSNAKRTHGKILVGLDKEVWYKGMLGRQDIPDLIQQDGDFIVRTTEVNAAPILAISVLHGGKQRHFAIKHKKAGFTVKDKAFPTIPDLVNHYWKKKNPIADGVFLLKPAAKPKWELDHSQIELGKLLGTGAFGDVRVATLTTVDGKQTVAVKTCKKKDLKKEEKERFLKEGRLIRHYHHPNIIAFIGIAAEQEPLMLVLEYAPNGSLVNYLTAAKRTKKVKCRFCYEAARGMEYLESLPKPVIHRDLAARNCLLGPHLEVKITDFGLSRDTRIYSMTGNRIVPVKWSAVETLRQGKYVSASDVWSYGVLLWEIFADGTEPYPGMTNKEVQKAVTALGYRMEPPSGMPVKHVEIMQSCWSDDPLKRPKFAHIAKKLESEGSTGR